MCTILARATVIVAAVYVALQDAKIAVVVGLVSGVLYGLERAIAAALRVAVECDIHRAIGRSLLEGDVLTIPTADLSRTVYEGAFHAIQLLTSFLPLVVADGVVALGATPLLVSLLPYRLVAVALCALATLTGGLLVARRWTRLLEVGAHAAYEAVADMITLVIDGRLEVVVRAGETETMQRLEDRLSVYRRASVRAAYGTALLARAPMALAVAAAGIALLIDASSRQMLVGVVVGNALLLVATIGPLLRAVLAVQGVVRALTLGERFIELLGVPPRADLLAPPGASPVLPSTIEAERLSFAYDANKSVLSSLRFSWSGEEPLVVAGPNGSGKSTLLRLLVGLRQPSEGWIRIGGVDLTTIDLRALRRSVAYLPQRPYLGEPHVTVGVAMRLGSARGTDEALRSALKRTGISDAFGDRKDPLLVSIGELSAGQRQRVALARVLLDSDAKLVLLDEPDANLDREGVAFVAALVRELAATGKMVVLVAHTSELAVVSPCRLELGAR